jgi:3-isopropylmalate dehydrogenase
MTPALSFEGVTFTFPGAAPAVEGVDLVVVRELTGGIYFGEPKGREENRPCRCRFRIGIGKPVV